MQVFLAASRQRKQGEVAVTKPQINTKRSSTVGKWRILLRILLTQILRMRQGDLLGDGKYYVSSTQSTYPFKSSPLGEWVNRYITSIRLISKWSYLEKKHQRLPYCCINCFLSRPVLNSQNQHTVFSRVEDRRMFAFLGFPLGDSFRLHRWLWYVARGESSAFSHQFGIK